MFVTTGEFQSVENNPEGIRTAIRFIRKFKPGKRAFLRDHNTLPAICEARYLGFDKIDKDTFFPIKGKPLTIQTLLMDDKWVNEFIDGPLLIARLCPVDYHRFHFPDEGNKLAEYRLRGPLHSVNPLALNWKPEILIVAGGK